MADDARPTTLRRPRRDSQRKAVAMRRAAKSLFLQEGFSNTSMDAIAREANVSKRTVYTHFNSKEVLFAEVIREMCEEVLPSSTLGTPDEARDIAATLARLGELFLKEILSREQVRLYRTVVSDSRLYPAIGKTMYEGPVKASQQGLADFFHRLVERGELELADCDLAATLFIAMLKSDVHMRLLFSVPVPRVKATIEATSRAAAELFLNGARPRT